MRNLLRLLPLAVLISIACAGCLAVGVTFKLAEVVLMMAAAGSGAIALAALDRRVPVANRSKKEGFVGLQRGGFGNPFDVHVAGGQPLAGVFSEVVGKGLAAKGFQPTTVQAAPVDSPDEVIGRLAATGSDKSVFIDIMEFKADTMQRVSFEYDVTVSVLDAQGNVVAQKRAQGKEALGGSFWNPAGHAKRAVPRAFKALLEELLNAPEIVSALQS